MEIEAVTPRVLMLCKGLPPLEIGGGVESFSEQVARAYLRRGIEVHMIAPTSGPPGWQTRTYPDGSIAIFNTCVDGQLVTAMRMARAVGKLTRRKSFDFVHSTTWRPALTTAVVRRRMPLVVSVHGREIVSVPPPMRPLMWQILRRAALVVAVSSSTRKRAAAHLGPFVNVSQWIVANNGLSFDPGELDSGESSRSTRDGESRTVRILTLARLVERKNIQGCIDALEALSRSGFTDFEYRIAGTGPLEATLRGAVERAGLAHLVKFLGYVPDAAIPDLYRWADIFLHPQVEADGGRDFEGFGLTIADAMSFGCLAIVGSGAGPSEFVMDGETGFVVDGNNASQLEETLRRVLQSPNNYGKIAAAGCSYVTRELSWDKHVGTVLDALDGTDSCAHRRCAGRQLKHDV
ncbi:MAG: glycosyltransferase family 4 protein [Mycolicibacterium rufum]|nr:glycosyltransferase family 4 protein [Mycolicibacterium rufum]